MIYTVHGQQVMLDSDLAELCDVLTRNLNKAASRNAERFSDDFRFRVSKEEYESLMFQTGISHDGGRGGRRKPPYVYTKQGVSMLSAVLRSEPCSGARSPSGRACRSYAPSSRCATS